MTGESKKLNRIKYSPLRIVEKIGINGFHLDVPSYMHMYLVIIVKNLKLYEPPLIMDEVEDVQVPTKDDFAHEYLDDL